MSPTRGMHHYLYDKSDIQSISNGFTMFSMWMSVWQQSILKGMSSVILARSSAFDWHNAFLWKLLQSKAKHSLLFSFHWISVLLI